MIKTTIGTLRNVVRMQMIEALELVHSVPKRSFEKPAVWALEAIQGVDLDPDLDLGDPSTWGTSGTRLYIIVSNSTIPVLDELDGHRVTRPEQMSAGDIMTFNSKEEADRWAELEGEKYNATLEFDDEGDPIFQDQDAEDTYHMFNVLHPKKLQLTGANLKAI